MTNIKAIRARHLLIEKYYKLVNSSATDSHNDRADLIAALDAAEARIKSAEARVKKLEDLIHVLVDNDPNDTISDSGHTVLDLWRHDARAAIAVSPYTLKGDTE